MDPSIEPVLSLGGARHADAVWVLEQPSFSSLG